MDDLGSVLKVVDSSGTVKNSYYYDPHGLSLNKNETVSNPWQYASGYYNATTGLYKFGTRYYDPQTGRWTQKDPVGGSVGKIGSGNPYVYAGNVPTMQVDPSGRDVSFACTQALAFAGFLGSLGLVGGDILLGQGVIFLLGIAQNAETASLLSILAGLGAPALAAIGVVGTVITVIAIVEAIAQACKH
jgi:RHS repeat-associated protein